MFSDFQYLELMQLAFRFDCFGFFSFHFDFVSLVTGTKVLYWITAATTALLGLQRWDCKANM